MCRKLRDHDHSWLLLSEQILVKISTHNISFLALFDRDRAGGGCRGRTQDYAREDHFEASLRIQIQDEFDSLINVIVWIKAGIKSKGRKVM